ncbi:MAG TPA: hypothetical protein VIN08_13980, partial [Ohtaekwangia sp.]|uniref:hypothetical protein n=1 Tax=Ohtaekwangia sp. TaxID=2066019 RepID=UPI002F95CAAA
MRIKFYLLFFFVAGIYNLSFAQGWVLEFTMLTGGTHPASSCSFANYEFTVGWALNVNAGGSMDNYGKNAKVTDHFYLSGTDWNSLKNKTINIGLNIVCSGSNVTVVGSDDASDNVNVNSTSCYNFGLSPTGSVAMKYKGMDAMYDFNMGYIFWPQLSINTVQSCDAITLSTPQCLKGTTVTWEVTNTPTVASSWKKVSKTSRQVTLTASELSALGLSSVYGVLYARASDATLAGRTSEPQAFNIYAPPPTVSIIGSSDVICKGEANGTVTLQISNSASQVNRFYINSFH